MSLVTTVQMPEGHGFRAHGQGRVIGFLTQRFGEPPLMRVIHLDYPGVIMESVVTEAVVSNLSLLPLIFPYTVLSSPVLCGASASRPGT